MNKASQRLPSHPGGGAADTEIKGQRFCAAVASNPLFARRRKGWRSDGPDESLLGALVLELRHLTPPSSFLLFELPLLIFLFLPEILVLELLLRRHGFHDGISELRYQPAADSVLHLISDHEDALVGARRHGNVNRQQLYVILQEEQRSTRASSEASVLPHSTEFISKNWKRVARPGLSSSSLRRSRAPFFQSP